jgi:hypothetical protein
MGDLFQDGDVATVDWPEVRDRISENLDAHSRIYAAIMLP